MRVVKEPSAIIAATTPAGVIGCSGADHRRRESHVVRRLLRGDVHPVPAGPREADGNVERRGGPGERGAQPAVRRPVRCGGRGRCVFGHRGDRPVHRALVRPRRALVFRASARPGAHGGVQRGRRRGVRGLRMVARDRVLRRSRSDRDRGPVGLQRRGHRRRSGPARQHGPHAGGKGPRGLAGQMVAFPWRLDEPPPYDVGTRIHHRQLRLEFVRDYRLLSHQRISVVLPQNVPGRDAGLATIKYGGMMLLLLCEV